MNRRFALDTGAQRILFAVIVATASPAVAAPKTGDAKVQFDRGVKAYTEGDFATAAEAFGASQAITSDSDTLFAWAQSERKIDHCEKAIELYGELLKLKLPAANKKAVRAQIKECKQIIAQRPPAPPVEAPVEPAPPVVVAQAMTPVVPAPPAPEGRPWWKDPVGDALLGLGLASIGTGGVLLVQARSASNQAPQADTHADAKALDDRARSRGQLGVIAASAGGALVAVSILWYATHRTKAARTPVTGWLAPAGGGLAISGSF